MRCECPELRHIFVLFPLDVIVEREVVGIVVNGDDFFIF